MIVLICVYIVSLSLASVVSTPCPDHPLPPTVVPWLDQAHTNTVTVEWAYGNMTCNSLATCFGLRDVIDQPMMPQLTSVHLQPGTNLEFFASTAMGYFSMQPFWVTEENFLSCDTTYGFPVVPRATNQSFIVPQDFLRDGINYFIVQTSDPIFKCQYGLRLNVTVREHQCEPPGETSMCHDRGRCAAAPLETHYGCYCCHGWTGKWCEREDACSSAPCTNGATCDNDLRDPTGTQYTCTCALGYYGSRCSYHVDDLCTLRVCENNATCSGNATHYECTCAAGFSGSHCEININECASYPCMNGVCYDLDNGYECYCSPGHGGSHCEEAFNECESSPCRNAGFCVESVEGWSCHCPQGYIGRNCAIKVDLCNPSPCFNATECIDYGSTYACTCSPGFKGLRCEININECASSPCWHNARCLDEAGRYRCICDHLHTGVHCETQLAPEIVRPPDYNYPAKESTVDHIGHLTAIVCTLAGALCIALIVLAICYVKYKHSARPQYAYTKHKSVSSHYNEEQAASSTPSTPHPTPSVSVVRPQSMPPRGSPPATLRTPLVQSMKSIRI